MLLALLVACGPPEAPDDIDGMSGFGFQHLPNEDERPLESLGEKLQAWLEDHFDETRAGYEVEPLTAEDLAPWGLDFEESPDVVGAMAGLEYTSSLDEVVHGFTWPDQAEIFTGILELEREELTDRACFLDGDCEEHRVVDQVHLAFGVLGIESEYEATMRFRHVDGPAGRAVGWGFVTPEEVVFNVDYVEVHQQYGFGWLFPHEGGTRAVQCLWLEGEIGEGVTVPEDFQLQTAIDGMLRSADELDAWLQGETD